VRDERGGTVAGDATVVTRSADAWWWTWAGARANATLAAALPGVVDPKVSYDNLRLRLRHDIAHGDLRAALDGVDWTGAVLPEVAPDAVRGLKFADILPAGLASATVAERLADQLGARDVRVVAAAARVTALVGPHADRPWLRASECRQRGRASAGRRSR
jgi:ATP-dependent helicase Lhr and Lhr-like helicase